MGRFLVNTRELGDSADVLSVLSARLGSIRTDLANGWSGVSLNAADDPKVRTMDPQGRFEVVSRRLVDADDALQGTTSTLRTTAENVTAADRLGHAGGSITASTRARITVTEPTTGMVPVATSVSTVLRQSRTTFAGGPNPSLKYMVGPEQDTDDGRSTVDTVLHYTGLSALGGLFSRGGGYLRKKLSEVDVFKTSGSWFMDEMKQVFSGDWKNPTTVFKMIGWACVGVGVGIALVAASPAIGITAAGAAGAFGMIWVGSLTLATVHLVPRHWSRRADVGQAASDALTGDGAGAGQTGGYVGDATTWVEDAASGIFEDTKSDATAIAANLKSSIGPKLKLEAKVQDIMIKEFNALEWEKASLTKLEEYASAGSEFDQIFANEQKWNMSVWLTDADGKGPWRRDEFLAEYKEKIEMRERMRSALGDNWPGWREENNQLRTDPNYQEAEIDRLERVFSDERFRRPSDDEIAAAQAKNSVEDRLVADFDGHYQSQGHSTTFGADVELIENAIYAHEYSDDPPATTEEVRGAYQRLQTATQASDAGYVTAGAEMDDLDSHTYVDMDNGYDWYRERVDSILSGGGETAYESDGTSCLEDMGVLSVD